MPGTGCCADGDAKEVLSVDDKVVNASDGLLWGSSEKFNSQNSVKQQLGLEGQLTSAPVKQ